MELSIQKFGRLLDIAEQATVTPNKRGAQSRETVLNAAEALMSEHGYEAASVSAIVKKSGIPLSSVYHYYGSKDGVLLAVMERGAERFFAELPELTERIGSPAEHLEAMTAGLLTALDQHPDFLRLLIVFATQPTAAGDGEVRGVVNRVRSEALRRLRRQLALAFGDDADDPVIDQIANFTLAAIDGAFIAKQSGLGAEPVQVLTPLATVATELRKCLRASLDRATA